MRPPDDHGWLFAVVFTVIPLSVFVLNSLIKVPKVNWTGPAWLAAVPLVALTWDMGGTSNGRRGRTGRPWWSPNSRGHALTLTLVLVSLLAWRLVGAPGLSDELRGEIRPWTEIGPAVGDLRSRIGREMSSEPIVVGMDTSEITSQLSFYDPLATKSNTAGWHLLGKWSEGFRYWQDPDQVLGRNLIMVSFDKPELEDPSLQGHFDDLGPLSEIEVAGGSELTTKIYYRIGFSYLGL